jgi:hypothetical protein
MCLQTHHEAAHQTYLIPTQHLKVTERFPER